MPTGASCGAPLVLVVEDDAFLRRLLALALGRAGYGVRVAADGVNGAHLARTLRPDLILTDIWMPQLDGIEAARLIRADPALRHIPIVTMTACETPEVRARVRAAGLLGPLTKPFDLTALPRQIAGWMMSGAATSCGTPSNSEWGTQSGYGLDGGSARSVQPRPS